MIETKKIKLAEVANLNQQDVTEKIFGEESRYWIEGSHLDVQRLHYAKIAECFTNSTSQLDFLTKEARVSPEYISEFAKMLYALGYNLYACDYVLISRFMHKEEHKYVEVYTDMPHTLADALIWVIDEIDKTYKQIESIRDRSEYDIGCDAVAAIAIAASIPYEERKLTFQLEEQEIKKIVERRVALLHALKHNALDRERYHNGALLEARIKNWH